jgi:hypothetical protein
MGTTMEEIIRARYGALRGEGKGHEEAMNHLIGGYGSRNTIERALRLTPFEAHFGVNGGQFVIIILAILAIVLGLCMIFGR